MSFLEKIKHVFAKPVTEPEANPNRYVQSIFNDPKVLDDIKRDGYSVMPFLKPEETASLYQDFLEILKMSEGQRTEFFWVSAFSANHELRAFAHNAIETKLAAHLGRVFNTAVAEFMGGTFLVKPTTKEGKNDPHQDSAHVDEAVSYAVYCWVPLVDITPENGPMCAIKGSHLWGNKYRSTVVPWYYKSVEQFFFKYGTPGYMKAGEMLIFDSALIHYTPSNTTDFPRPAINYFVKPKNMELVYYFKDKDTPKGKVEEFALSKEFYYTYDWFSRPPEKFKTRVLNNNLPPLNEAKLDALYKRFLN